MNEEPLQQKPLVRVLGEVKGSDETKGRDFMLVKYGWEEGTFLVSRQTVQQFKKAGMDVHDDPKDYVFA